MTTLRHVEEAADYVAFAHNVSPDIAAAFVRTLPGRVSANGAFVDRQWSTDRLDALANKYFRASAGRAGADHVYCSDCGAEYDRFGGGTCWQCDQGV